MNIQQDFLSSPIAVTSVDATGIVINGRRHETSLLFGSRMQPVAWQPAETRAYDAVAEALIAHFGSASAVVLLGTGPRLVFPPPAVRRRWAQAGLVVEVMDTAAACRTFNLLVGEGRDVHVAVLLTDGLTDGLTTTAP